MNSAVLENLSVIVHGSTIGSHRWQKTGTNSCLVQQNSLQNLSQESNPFTTECHDVEYSHSRAAGYLKIGWRTNISHMDKSQSSSEYYYCLYWAHALIGHYLTTGSMRLLKICT